VNRHVLRVGGLSLVLVGVLVWISPAAGPQPKEPPKDIESAFPDLVAAVKSTPGCLGVETAKTDSGKTVIFAWFEDKKAALKWYYSETHQKLIKQFFPGGRPGADRDRKPLADVPDDGGPIMVVASVTPADKPTKENPRPFKQIAIEIYQPLGGGLAIGGRFAPKEMKLPTPKDKPEE
jgi:quinol monooxygenase YgiN